MRDSARLRHAPRAGNAERAAAASLAVGAVFLATAPFAVTFIRGRTEKLNAIAAARDRVASVIRVRHGDASPGADERFDQLVASLHAGLGYDTPAALGPVLSEILDNRTREGPAIGAALRPVGSPGAAIDLALVRAERLLLHLEAEAGGHDPGAFPVVPGSPGHLCLLGASVCLAFGLACVRRASARWRDERIRVGRLIGLDPAECDAENLAAEVGLFIVRLRAGSDRPPATVSETAERQSRAALQRVPQRDDRARHLVSSREHFDAVSAGANGADSPCQPAYPTPHAGPRRIGRLLDVTPVFGNGQLEGSCTPGPQTGGRGSAAFDPGAPNPVSHA